MAEKSPKPLRFSKTVGVPPARTGRTGLALGNAGGRPRLAVASRVPVDDDGQEPAPDGPQTRSHNEPDDFGLEALVGEWLLELRMMGRRPRTIEWYRQKMTWYLKTGQAETLGQLTTYELKRYLGELRDRDLADNTIHGFFEVLRAFASWADREGYPVDPALLRVKAPKVAQKEVETYSTEQIERIFAAASPGWPTMAVKVLLGTGMRLSELCGLIVEDFEDDGVSAFLKVRHGKGAKFRRVPVSSRLRREMVRYLNRWRPASRHSNLLLRADGEPVGVCGCGRTVPSDPSEGRLWRSRSPLPPHLRH
jgi:integrase